MPHTLLLADDSVTIQRVIELTFADEDVQVVAVGDGDQAIARLQSSPPDIVLADIGMPGKDGYEVAQFIRQTPALAAIPVVLLTGAFEPVDQERAAACDGVLAKPFEPQLVITRVKELLAKRPGGLQPAGASKAAPQTPAAPAPAAAPNALDEYFDRLDAAFASFDAPAAAAPAASLPAPTPNSDLDWFNAVPEATPAAEPWDFRPASTDAAPPVDMPLTYASPQPPVPLEAPSLGTIPAGPPAAFEPQAALDVPVSRQSTRPAEALTFGPPAMQSPVEAIESSRAPLPVAVPAQIAAPEPAHVAPTIAAPTMETPPAGATVRPVDSVSPSRAAAPHALPMVASMPPLADAFASLLAAEASAPATAVLSWPVSAPPAAVVTDDLVEAIVRRVLDRLSDHVVRDAVAERVSHVAEQLVREEIERIKAGLK